VFVCSVQTFMGNSTGVIGLVMGRDIGTVVSRVGVRTSVRRLGGTVGANKCSANACSLGAMAVVMTLVTNKCSAYFARILPVS
jgi:hypothetical protein